MNARTMGTYELEGLLGEGGIGQVYAAQDKVLGRPVAIKMLRAELSRDSNFVDRFHIEAKSLGNLNHSNITTLYALHAEGDDAFMVMELVHGQTLEALLARVQRLTLRDSLAVLAQTVAGMRYAHRRGVIHRDIKPANLMVTDDGVVKIMDFGIARVRGSEHLTRVGEFCGTFVYASPEQIRGEEVDERSDLYSLAIVFYRMLAGTAPFTSDNEYALMTAQLQATPPPLAGRVPDLDAATESVLMRALAKRPEDRFASVEAFGRAVGAMALRGESIDILQQLYARAFGSDDLEATRVFSAARPAAVDPTMPSNRPNGRSADWELPPSRPSAAAADPEPWSNRPDPQSLAPSPQASIWPLAAPPNERAVPRSWLIGAGVLALPLLLGGGYYLFAPNGPIPTHSSSAPQTIAAADPTPTPPPSPMPTTSPPEPREPVRADPQPPPVSPPGPEEVAKGEPLLSVLPPPAPAEPAKFEPPLPPPAPPPAPTRPASTEPPSSTAPVEAVPSGSQSAQVAPNEPATTEPPARPSGPNSGVQVATAEPPATPAPAPSLGPQAPAAAPKPEGEPDLEGRVTGAKGFNEIELDKTRWIKVYGIVDRATGSLEAKHAEALVRYLKPSHNHVVCYRKSGDTYRCYSDGQDIARLALLDRLVQLAPNAPPEYRSLLAQRR